MFARKPAVKPAQKPASKPWLTVDYEREAFVFRLPDGLPVVTHYSFLLTALIVTAPISLQGTMSNIVVALVLAAVLFLSILGHELGHVAAARAQKADASSIDIGLFGGLANLVWDQNRGIAMRRVAFAGPVVNLALAGAFFAAYWSLVQFGTADAGGRITPFEAPAMLSRILYLSAILNLGLGALNLLPAFPLDGGVIAQDILSTRIGDRRANLIVGACGLVVTIVGGFVALVALLLGTPVFAPFSPRQNWRAIVDNWRTSPREQSSRPTPFAKPSKVVTFRPRSK